MKLLDLYVLRQFVSTLVFALLSLILIFIVVDLVEHLDDFIDKKAETWVIIEFYLNYVPWMLKLLVPIAMLVASLFSIGRLSNLSEIIAMRSGGISLMRLMVPIAVFSMAVSAGQLYFNGWIIPRSNEKKLAIERKYLGATNEAVTLYNLYLRDTPLRNIIIQYYDGVQKSANQVTIEEYGNEKHPRMTKRIDANFMNWDSVHKEWKCLDVMERTFADGKISSTYRKELPLPLNITHHQIMQLQRSTDEMNLDELRDYIGVVSRGGKDVRRQMIDYYGQFAFPFANVIVVFFGVSFASVRRRNGLAIQIAAAMVVSFVYLIFLKIGQAIGYSYDIDAALVGWLPNIIFFIIAIATVLRTRT